MFTSCHSEKVLFGRNDGNIAFYDQSELEKIVDLETWTKVVHTTCPALGKRTFMKGQFCDPRSAAVRFTKPCEPARKARRTTIHPAVHHYG
ncbi:hypothetical protein BV898_08829 [Hypsibius exemplaris]|uniref:Uncharacterized protein n=1 Tax=Hypsibius exemplaris TaxID=2072580 RepID=A0A1W0WPJ0_HYPEX|nr:hypothetical protein BV898_08829 [Hypsibius exemplaris]